MVLSVSELGLIVYGVTALTYLYLLVRIARWRDGVGLMAMRLMFFALFLHSSLSMLIRSYLLSGGDMVDVALYILFVQFVLLGAALYMAYIIHKRWPTTKKP